jgi:uncharacterized protein YfeS
MADRRYFDDEESGLSPETSHPTFVTLCAGDDFFYNCTNDFAPFGSDAGADTLEALEAWFQEPEDRPTREFIDQMMDEWDMRLPDLLETDDTVVRSWLADEKLATHFSQINPMLIATAFGELKITGSVTREIRALAIAAARRETIYTAYSSETHPTWRHAADKAVADSRIQRVLETMPIAPDPS